MENNKNYWKVKYNSLGSKSAYDILSDICKENIVDTVYATVYKIDNKIESMYSESNFTNVFNGFAKKPEDELGENKNDTIETYVFSIKSINFAEYEYKICFLEYDFTMYPLRLILDSDISNELGYKGIIEIQNEKDFKEFIQKVIQTQKVTSIIEGLITANNKR